MTMTSDAYWLGLERDQELERMFERMEYDDQYEKALSCIGVYMAKHASNICNEILEVSEATNIDIATIIKEMVLPELEVSIRDMFDTYIEDKR